MKRTLIITFVTLTAFSLFGCSKGTVEKEPVVIHETVRNGADQITEAITASISPDPSDVTTEQPDYEQSDGASKTTDSINEVDSGGGISNDNMKVDEEIYTSTILLEGMNEEVRYQNYQSSIGYQMAYDVDRFTVTNKDGIDSYTAANPDPELYPYIFINISKNGGNSANKSSDTSVEDDFNKTYGDNSTTEKVTIGSANYNALHTRLVEGKEWNSLIKERYIIKTESDVYTIEIQYYLEASEGFGARIQAMLDTFTIL